MIKHIEKFSSKFNEKNSRKSIAKNTPVPCQFLHDCKICKAFDKKRYQECVESGSFPENQSEYDLIVSSMWCELATT